MNASRYRTTSKANTPEAGGCGNTPQHYWGCESDYGKQLFSRDRFNELAAVLAVLKGRFILSLNDVQQVRETFSAFQFREVKTTYSIGAKGASPSVGEVLISNYPLGQD